ncbi:MAG: hypothetical protein ABFD89_27065 [Bryobacteraceae bacterium]
MSRRSLITLTGDELVLERPEMEIVEPDPGRCGSDLTGIVTRKSIGYQENLHAEFWI